LKNKFDICKYALLALVLLPLCVSCAKKAPTFSLPQDQRVGVVGFYQPVATVELLAGYLPDVVQPVDAAILARLDDDFERVLRDTTSRDYAGTEESYQCVKTVRESGAPSAFEFWLAVGQCLLVEVGLEPQLHAWQERLGGELGAEQPAAVVMDFFLLDVNNKLLLARSRFDETQKALSANILDIGKWMSRGGKWVSAGDLALEGMARAVRELGL
jgi:hypothetical protein